MRKLLLTAAAVMSVAWIAFVANRMPAPQSDVFSSDDPLSGYGVYAASAVQHR